MIPSELLLGAYASGWFPMADDVGAISWYSPDPRGVLPLDAFHVPSRLRRVLRKQAFRIEIDRAFERVIRACAEAKREPGESGTWISDEIVESYCALHELGYAHSVEAWDADRLVGGLYGVALGGALKVALVALVERLQSRGFSLLDTQWVTEHLQQFGAIEIPRSEYLRRLGTSLRNVSAFV